MAELKGATGQAPKWAPPEGLLEYVRVPGHAPGQMALLHKPSGSLLMADTLANLGGGLLKKAPPQLGLVPPGVPSADDCDHTGCLLVIQDLASSCSSFLGKSERYLWCFSLGPREMKGLQRRISKYMIFAAVLMGNARDSPGGCAILLTFTLWLVLLQGPHTT